MDELKVEMRPESGTVIISGRCGGEVHVDVDRLPELIELLQEAKKESLLVLSGWEPPEFTEDRYDLKEFEGEVHLYSFARRGGNDYLAGPPFRYPDEAMAILVVALRDQGYTVHCWAGGARAWKGDPWPIRRGVQIRKCREQVESDIRCGRLPRDGGLLGRDMAYDL